MNQLLECRAYVHKVFGCFLNIINPFKRINNNCSINLVMVECEMCKLIFILLVGLSLSGNVYAKDYWSNEKCEELKDITIISRTHGQPASPTKLGKEFKVFLIIDIYI